MTKEAALEDEEVDSLDMSRGTYLFHSRCRTCVKLVLQLQFLRYQCSTASNSCTHVQDELFLKILPNAMRTLT